MLVNQNNLYVSSMTSDIINLKDKIMFNQKRKLIKGKRMQSFQKLYVSWPLDKSDQFQSLFFSRNLKPNEELKRILKNEFIVRMNQNISADLNEEDVELSWSKHCGCNTCPCSPGYNVYYNSDTIFNRKGLYEKLRNITTSWIKLETT